LRQPANSLPSLSSPPCLLFGDTPTTRLYPLSLHDALPILGFPGRKQLSAKTPPSSRRASPETSAPDPDGSRPGPGSRSASPGPVDRKSTRLNSSHVKISYAVFCLKKKMTRLAVGCTPENAA